MNVSTQTLRKGVMLIDKQGRNNRFSDYGMSAAQEPGSQASSLSQNTKNGGDWGIWSGPQMRASPFGGVQNDRRG